MPTLPTSIAAALVLGLLLTLPTHAASQTLLIRDVSVISAELEAPIAHQDVQIEAGRISAIEPARADRHADTELDGRGRFLSPGLIDSHVHLHTGTGLKRRYTEDFDALYEEFQRQQPRSFLYHGYTTLIENNGDPVVDQQFERAPLHPRLIQCGPAAVLSNDFMATDFDSAADFHAAFPHFLHDRHRTPTLPAGIDPALHTPAAVVAAIAASGGRCVKLYYEEALWWPGEHRPDFALPSVAIVREIIAEAHARKMTVLLHGTTPAAHRFGLATGVDVMAHGLWDWPGAMYGQPDIPDDVLATADAVAASAMRVQPTWMAVDGMTSMFKPKLLNDPGYAKVLPADYLVYLRGPGQQARADYLRRFGPFIAAAHARGEAISADPAVIMRAFQQRYRSILQRQHQAGAKFLFGTDTSVGTPGWGNPPGLSGRWEMQAWSAAGIDPLTILRAATIDNARAFGLADEIGSIEVGKRADLLLLGGNPLHGVDAFDRIEQVILAGVVIERDSLAADASAAVGDRSLRGAANAVSESEGAEFIQATCETR
jgi:imidazolonepropionase-like amidohydrolase